MKVAIVGSRGIKSIDLSKYAVDVDEIVSGGADGVDTIAADYARRNGIKLTEFLPNYESFGRAAPIVRNKSIVDYADRIIVFWDGRSKGTLFVIKYAKKTNKPCKIIEVNDCVKLI